MSKMIFRWNVTFLFLVVQFVYTRVIDVDPEEVKAKATGKNKVRGEATYEGQYPFSVIFYEYKPRVISIGVFLSPICSGSIISSRWILTTAIPLGDYEINTYYLLVGLQEVSHDPDTVTNFTNNKYQIETMVVHPKWHEYDVNNLGMARTTESLNFGKELGTIRIPSRYNVKTEEGYNDTLCTMNIWASKRVQHLMGSYQVESITKQSIYLNIKKDPLLFCPDIIFTNHTLCLVQFDSANPQDVCRVNLGAIVMYYCQAVGLFTGVKGKLDCVDVPPLRYTAVNLTQYLKWITMVSKTIDIQDHLVHAISSASFMCLSFNLTSTYFIVLLKSVF